MANKLAVKERERAKSADIFSEIEKLAPGNTALVSHVREYGEAKQREALAAAQGIEAAKQMPRRSFLRTLGLGAVGLGVLGTGVAAVGVAGANYGADKAKEAAAKTVEEQLNLIRDMFESAGKIPGPFLHFGGEVGKKTITSWNADLISELGSACVEYGTSKNSKLDDLMKHIDAAVSKQNDVNISEAWKNLKDAINDFRKKVDKFKILNERGEIDVKEKMNHILEDLEKNLRKGIEKDVGFKIPAEIKIQ